MTRQMESIKTIEAFYNAIENEEKVIMYFYTKWCPDCFVIKRHLGKLEDDFKSYKFYRFDRDKSIELAKHLEIYGFPSFVVYKNGDEIGRLVNKKRKSYIEVKEFISSVI